MALKCQAQIPQCRSRGPKWLVQHWIDAEDGPGVEHVTMCDRHLQMTLIQRPRRIISVVQWDYAEYAHHDGATTREENNASKP